MPQKLFTARLNIYTREQILRLASALDATQTQIVALAVDHFATMHGIDENAASTERTAYIYALCDPGTINIRYVGKTVDIKSRLVNHYYGNTTKYGMNPCLKWLNELKSDNRRPDVIVLEETTESHWQERERFWIEHLISHGADLLNISSGGLTGSWMKTYEAWDEPPVTRSKRKESDRDH